ncbi:hypothetical protein LJY18_00900 [Pseudomonas sp. MMS21-TM103]|uniref:hypothetical protein n=1 Tax=Pseudomonas sp. MMS21 TM103 TaxID=2886506 RepID=UPI001EE10CE4|nr:hypothetical protein [Pseudomonas sp. MMS21 TM103]MCG4451861.1 hypothetical protein [Pseudomonas sp. MMS21 TM103]
MKDARNRLKNAELLSLIGACIATGGIALFLQSWLEPFKLLLLLGGLAVHAAAMYYRHRLERAAGSMPTHWERWLYWSCWLILAMLASYILVVGPSQTAA